MIALDIIFLFFIGIAVTVSIVFLLTPVREKVINFITENLREREIELEECKTIYLENYKNLEKLCNICDKIGKKVKKSCICYVVYSNEVITNECEIDCNIKNNKIWLIKFFADEGKSKIIC